MRLELGDWRRGLTWQQGRQLLKKTKLPCQETSPQSRGNNKKKKNEKRKRGIASGQGASSSPLFMEMFLVPSFKLWLGDGGCFN